MAATTTTTSGSKTSSSSVDPVAASLKIDVMRDLKSAKKFKKAIRDMSKHAVKQLDGVDEPHRSPAKTATTIVSDAINSYDVDTQMSRKNTTAFNYKGSVSNSCGLDDRCRRFIFVVKYIRYFVLVACCRRMLLSIFVFFWRRNLDILISISSIDIVVYFSS